MTERMKKMLYNLYKGIANESVDSNDQLYYIELLKANADYIDTVLNGSWFISNNYNSKNMFKIDFEFNNDGFVKPYISDGNLNKRYISEFGYPEYITVDFPQNTKEFNANLAREEMKKLLPEHQDLTALKGITKDNLINKTEKCFEIVANQLSLLIPKSIIGFDGDSVIVPVWWTKKNSLALKIMNLI